MACSSSLVIQVMFLFGSILLFITFMIYFLDSDYTYWILMICLLITGLLMMFLSCFASCWVPAWNKAFNNSSNNTQSNAYQMRNTSSTSPSESIGNDTDAYLPPYIPPSFVIIPPHNVDENGLAHMDTPQGRPPSYKSLDIARTNGG